ncbi:hypothetical protein [Pseudomonas typographi]|uniref:hypothetical protein n=1 Tax=Pseudomonas typographi TaxID=2715964 RepID=UPI001688DEDA|nr:hypothetical protein [Pseudomonas typographi]MBD1589499.1 hypothetical protein [Pseudomonas typographi]
MTTPIHKSLIDEQIDEVKVQIGGEAYPAKTRVYDLKKQIKADWLKRRPVEKRT